MAVGATVVAGAAALLDLRPHRGARSGQLTGAAFATAWALATVFPWVAPACLVAAVLGIWRGRPATVVG